MKYTLDKENFKLYRSAEVHTKQNRTIPRAVFLGAFMVLASAGAIGYILTQDGPVQNLFFGEQEQAETDHQQADPDPEQSPLQRTPREPSEEPAQLAKKAIKRWSVKSHSSATVGGVVIAGTTVLESDDGERKRVQAGFCKQTAGTMYRCVVDGEIVLAPFKYDPPITRPTWDPQYVADR